jgi:AraC-like DNA-binding protein
MIETLRLADWFHPDGFPIAVEPCNPQPPVGLHDHEFAEIVVITGGHGRHVTGKDAWTIRAGDAFVIAGRRPHMYEDIEGLALYNVLFQPDRVLGNASDLVGVPGYRALFTLEPVWRTTHEFKSRLHLSRQDLTTVTLLIQQLEKELQARQTGFRCMATSLFMQLVCGLSRCYEQSEHPDSASLLRIAAAISELETNYQEAIDLEKLASIAGTTKRSLLRAFEKALGVSPIAYLIHVRISRACEYLVNRDDLSITEIAFQVGFEDSNYFARQFHAITGTTPSAFRRQQIKLPPLPRKQPRDY